MMRRIARPLLLLLGLLVMEGCGPDPPIPPEQMEELVYQTARLNASLRRDDESLSGYRKGLVDPYTLLLDSLQLTPALVDSASRYYSNNLKELEEIVGRAIARFERDLEEIQHAADSSQSADIIPQ